MSSLIYNPYTVEYDGCEDCCPQYEIVTNSCFPDGVAKCWEFTLNLSNYDCTHCSNLNGVWVASFNNIWPTCVRAQTPGGCSAGAYYGSPTMINRGFCFDRRLVSIGPNTIRWGISCCSISSTNDYVGVNGMYLSSCIPSISFNISDFYFRIRRDLFNPFGPNTLDVIQRWDLESTNPIFAIGCIPDPITIVPIECPSYIL